MARRAARSLRLLTYNIQAGARVARLSHYITQGWKQLLPHREKLLNLERVARLIAEFDIVGLQEADPGSLRSGFVNQAEFLAASAGFPFWTQQTNRNLARIVRSGNALISRFEPLLVLDLTLPGRLPGRGALLAEYGSDGRRLCVVNVHLSLGEQARRRQLDFLGELIGEREHVVLMGDFNTRVDGRELERLYRRTRLEPPPAAPLSFPSWRPRRPIDHVLVSRGLTVRTIETLPLALSDHLPVAVEIGLPGSLAGALQSR